MKHFLENHVCCFENHRELKVHFIGSMSYIFQEQLKFAANELNISLGSIIKNPIDSLVSYHINNPAIV